MTTNSYPRETNEFAPVTVEVDGVVVTSGVTFAVVPDKTRPTTFTAAVALSGKIGIMIAGFAPTIDGTPYHVWAKVASAPEIPVIDCGVFYIS